MEKLLNKLERKLGRYAIQNLMLYIIVLYIVGFALDLLAPGVYYEWLALDAAEILRGQVWRIVTFIIQPPNSSTLFMIFALYLYYMIGRELEYVWGSFRFNLYFFTGVLLHVIAALLAYAITKVSLPMGTEYLNLSLFFAYAAVYPEQRLYLFGIIPVKMKYLAWIDGAYFGYAIIQAFMPQYGGNPTYGVYFQSAALAAFVSVLNFLLFLLVMKSSRYSPKQVKRKREYRRGVAEGQRVRADESGARHRCTICGRTELDDPNLEFRYCSKCNGNYEYCQDHLFTHEHMK